jgi:hypothetical protein
MNDSERQYKKYKTYKNQNKQRIMNKKLTVIIIRREILKEKKLNCPESAIQIFSYFKISKIIHKSTKLK